MVYRHPLNTPPRISLLASLRPGAGIKGHSESALSSVPNRQGAPPKLTQIYLLFRPILRARFRPRSDCHCSDCPRPPPTTQSVFGAAFGVVRRIRRVDGRVRKSKSNSIIVAAEQRRRVLFIPGVL